MSHGQPLINTNRPVLPQELWICIFAFSLRGSHKQASRVYFTLLNRPNDIISEEFFGRQSLGEIRLDHSSEDENEQDLPGADYILQFLSRSGLKLAQDLVRRWFDFEHPGKEKVRGEPYRIVVSGGDNAGKTSVLHYIKENCPCPKSSKVLRTGFPVPFETTFPLNKRTGVDPRKVSLIEIPQAIAERLGFPDSRETFAIYVVDATRDWYISEEDATNKLVQLSGRIASEKLKAIDIRRVSSAMYDDFHSFLGWARCLNHLSTCSWYEHAVVKAFPTCARTGEGIDAAITWFSTLL